MKGRPYRLNASSRPDRHAAAEIFIRKKPPLCSSRPYTFLERGSCGDASISNLGANIECDMTICKTLLSKTVWHLRDVR